MAIRNKDELITAFSEIIGDRNDDTVLNFIEDISDTIADGNTDYKVKYEQEVQRCQQIEDDWRKRYRERFEQGNDRDDSDPDPNRQPPKKYTFEALFKEDE